MTMEAVIPGILKELNATIPFARYIIPDGSMNLVRVRFSNKKIAEVYT